MGSDTSADHDPAYALTASARHTDDEPMELRPRPSRANRVLAIVVLVLALSLAAGFATNERLQWDVVGDYFFSSRILHGLWTTLWLTAVTVVLGFVLGIPLALMRRSSNPVLTAISWTYIWIFRSIPVLVQLLFWFNLGAIFPTISVGLPFGDQLTKASESLGGPALNGSLLTIDTRSLITALTAAVIGLVLHEAAIAAEIIRGGLNSVDIGQGEAAYSLGLSRWRVFRRIILPQAMNAIVPAAGNMVITTLKGTSIVSVIAVMDLLYSAQTIYAVNYQILPLLVVATLWYLLCTSGLGAVQYYIERHYSQGALRNLPPTPIQRLRRKLRTPGARGRGRP